MEGWSRRCWTRLLSVAGLRPGTPIGVADPATAGAFSVAGFGWLTGLVLLFALTDHHQLTLFVGVVVVVRLALGAMALRVWLLQRRDVATARRHQKVTETIAEAVRAILRQDNGRLAVVRAAKVIGSAAAANLFEADGHGDLVCTSATIEDLVGLRTPADGDGVVARCYSGGRPIWSDRSPGASHRPPREAGIDPDLLAVGERGAGSRLQGGAAFPIINAGRCLGVLGIAWAPGVRPPRDQSAALQLLADEAALALSHHNLLLELQRLSHSDALTGIANRRAWEIAMSEEMTRALRAGTSLALLMIDLDHFKAFNDAHGHAEGDRLLRHAAAAWTARLRPGDLLCRWGGEEFAVLLRSSTLENAVRVAEDLRTLMPAGATCSIGATVWDSREVPEALLARADAALYDAKVAGRDRVHARPAAPAAGGLAAP